MTRAASSHASDGRRLNESDCRLSDFAVLIEQRTELTSYALADRVEDAQALMERLLALQNDVGLLAEEYDPAQQRFVGNFPQAFSHLALVGAAHQLDRAVRRTAPQGPRPAHRPSGG